MARKAAMDGSLIHNKYPSSVASRPRHVQKSVLINTLILQTTTRQPLSAMSGVLAFLIRNFNISAGFDFRIDNIDRNHGLHHACSERPNAALADLRREIDKLKRQTQSIDPAHRKTANDQSPSTFIAGTEKKMKSLEGEAVTPQSRLHSFMWKSG